MSDFVCIDQNELMLISGGANWERFWASTGTAAGFVGTATTIGNAVATATVVTAGVGLAAGAGIAICVAGAGVAAGYALSSLMN